MLDAPLSLTTWPANPSRSDFVESYARASGDVDHVSGSNATDPRYANLVTGVRALCGLAWQAAQKGRIDELY